MFTGIVEAVGTVQKQHGDVLIIRAPWSKTLKLGQSIAVNGVCLTVVKKNRNQFQVQVLKETKKLTNLGTLKSGDLVNLERTMKATGRLDGHIVQGHVEGKGKIGSLGSLGDRIIRLRVPQTLLKYMIWKGIVILDGIAFTITDIDDRKAEIEVAITAYTWENTNLRGRKVGDQVNIETDILAKYLEKLVAGSL